ncbi:hypothetical protein GCM10011403_28100 [Pseudohongiella nitratireducens]|uniref:Peptidase S9 prolyl oligopeptidase catalytic domain-containing protein n=1 Tax=Pseudohongiella nitratireducens TaxID=1768907 RepID=A0A916VK31_9GAMM|nr:prolyl oligopeptidase family serine peptidase [Pseudohongiella nitratireducens]GFZ82965.1 hypothetical protein GCM10011403_28100 [Pseudohongiella nitratireducens]
MLNPINSLISIIAAMLLISSVPALAQRPWRAGPVPVSIPVGDINYEGMIYDVGPESDELKPAIIHIHGWRPEGEHAGVDASYYAHYFSDRQNIMGLVITLRGWPHTGGVNDCGLVQPDDVSKVVEWLSQQPGVDPDRIGILGESQGGQVGLLTAAINSRVKAVIAFYPLTDVTTWHEATDLDEGMIDSYVNGVCATPGTKKDRSPLFVADQINASVLMLHGEADTRVSIDQSERMHAALTAEGKDSALIRIDNGTHYYGSPEWDEWVTLDRVFEWLDGRL